MWTLCTISTPETQAVVVEISSPGASILITLPKYESLNWGGRTVIRTVGNVHPHRKLGAQLYKELYGLLESGEINVRS